jgi:hypothetical protein
VYRKRGIISRIFLFVKKILHNPYRFYDKYQQYKLEGGLQWLKPKQIFPKTPGNAAIAAIRKSRLPRRRLALSAGKSAFFLT